VGFGFVFMAARWICTKFMIDYHIGTTADVQIDTTEAKRLPSASQNAPM